MDLWAALILLAVAASVFILFGALLVYAIALKKLVDVLIDLANARSQMVAIREAQAEELAASAAEVAVGQGPSVVDRPGFADAELDRPGGPNGRRPGSAEDWPDTTRPEYVEERMGGRVDAK